MKTLKIFSSFIFIFLVVLICQVSFSSNKPQDAVTVAVRDLNTGTYLDGVTVRLCGTGGTYSDVTSGGGFVYFSYVPPGNYCLDGVTTGLIGSGSETVTSSGDSFVLYVSASEVPLCTNCD